MFKPIARKIVYFFVLFTLLSHSTAKTNAFNPLTQIDHFLGKKIVISAEVNKNELPSPYDFLLTQHLMTIGVEQYYHRTPEIQSIHITKNPKANTYSRVVTLLIDRDRARNNVKIAQMKQDTLAVELAFITINFNALPQKVINAVLNTQVPFGKLLATNKIETLNINRHYFSAQCNEVIAKYISCNKNAVIYGRTNTIIRKKDKQWLAQVVEILSGAKCGDKDCQWIYP
ncbi:hypothetical protein [Legionella maceachernii]|uniref:Uncharacterized protein n=1 Tax=Legionella maceachernii TaxID=466 RepID=A0A0W0W0J4_9GAMM|nr:hypothetical protein [Legionella maceachernii]KTD25957.1 hypothetical protein Lmac_1728 [Legionella maceachernii]SJZ49341.1 hypothetical protein SAMN02745128_00235 [Legionella maceachernii]SUP03798.1 Uncharacterised protein [Legionella maceachernii]